MHEKPQLAASIRDLTKDYVLSGETVHALRGVSFDVPVGDYISIMGPSGSGKSTLLNLLGLPRSPYVWFVSPGSLTTSPKWTTTNFPKREQPVSASCFNRTTCCQRSQ